MSIIASDNLSLLIGDGGGPEVFAALKGASIARFEMTQKSNVANAISADGWLVEAGASGRRAVIECEAYATDEAPAVRLRTLALGSTTGNFKLEITPTQSLVFAAVVTSYREVIGAGEMKRLLCRLESSGAVTVV